MNNKKFTHCLERLYKEDYMRFYKKAYSILQNDADAKDVVNDAFVKSYRYIDKISQKRCPEIKAYFVSIVKSVSINLKNRQRKVILSEHSDNLIDSVACSQGADVLLEQMMKHEDLNSLLSDLSQLEKEILEIKLIDGLTFKEISKKVGMSEEAVKKRYQRIIKKLRAKKGGSK